MILGLSYLLTSGIFAAFAAANWANKETGMMVVCLTLTGLLYSASVKKLIELNKGE